MRTPYVFKLASDAPAPEVAKIFNIIHSMDRVDKNDTHKIHEVLYRDPRGKYRTYIVPFDEETGCKFQQRCNAAGLSACIDTEYVSPPDRHYVDVQASGLIKLHWSKKDTFIRVKPDDTYRHEILGPTSEQTGIYPKEIFFVGPIKQINKAYRRYLSVMRKLHTSNGYLTTYQLDDILSAIETTGEAYGGAMYILTETGLIAQLTRTGFHWVINRPPVSEDQRRSRVIHGYNETVIGVGKADWYTNYFRGRVKNLAFCESLLKAGVTQEAYLKL
ncbi:hypothetical protein ST201phi2-1p411 [Pseudomonas phage 201phi2-1]|uniref:Uncharacterized protein n=1 Tax=Pseudomonas phage 201phi2-1 TaxID=198110 RepID=B3FJS0_BP201|nr:hypothetical protein ST201phi2-1p411 [Pseudomonas phage 201phi2-1]ABY63235.1 hypothetical protein 201phi2-1p411 [Pseudomonas phage 201phi2-1]